MLPSDSLMLHVANIQTIVILKKYNQEQKIMGNRIGKAKMKEPRNLNYMEWIKWEEHKHGEILSSSLFIWVSYFFLPVPYLDSNYRPDILTILHMSHALPFVPSFHFIELSLWIFSSTVFSSSLILSAAVPNQFLYPSRCSQTFFLSFRILIFSQFIFSAKILTLSFISLSILNKNLKSVPDISTIWISCGSVVSIV